MINRTTSVAVIPKQRHCQSLSNLSSRKLWAANLYPMTIASRTMIATMTSWTITQPQKDPRFRLNCDANLAAPFAMIPCFTPSRCCAATLFVEPASVGGSITKHRAQHRKTIRHHMVLHIHTGIVPPAGSLSYSPNRPPWVSTRHSVPVSPHCWAKSWPLACEPSARRSDTQPRGKTRGPIVGDTPWCAPPTAIRG